MRVLVTGASGFLGSHVAEQLVQQGHGVVALVRRSSNTRFLASLRGVELVYGAVEDAESVRRAVVDTEGVDAIVHSAGLVKARDEAEFFRVNVEGTRNMLEAAKAAPSVKRFVFVSSLAAIGPSADGRPVAPDARPSPVTRYGRSKLEAERLVLAEKDALPVVVLRPPMIYGPRDQESFAFFQSVSRRFLPMLGDGRNTLSVIYATDAAAACIRALERDTPSGRAYFIDDGRVYVWRDMLADVEAALGARAFVRVGVPFSLMRGAALASEGLGRLTGKAVMLTRDKLNELAAPHWVCDSSEAQRELGFRPEVGWAEGTRRAVAWYREHGWL
ncbi:epimerase [Sorangium cellulosum]|uniref:Epimerase n=1 Tax=Sorangium cellulosum TaxID=56 RepID=A0A4P2Q9F0_SORCE|nr:SDR family NAD(P)-dependent oxidoreductase [Sorangium cellulosum]AUX25856.1 epimerase [Sorangium cellulosum]